MKADALTIFLTQLVSFGVVQLLFLSFLVLLVLIFGSFTWPPFRRRSGDMETL